MYRQLKPTCTRQINGEKSINYDPMNDAILQKRHKFLNLMTLSTILL